MACSFGTAKADCPPRYNCHVIAIIQSLPGYYIRSLTHTNTHTYRSICFGCGNGCPILFNMCCCCCCCRQYFKHNFLCSHNFTLSSLINNALSRSLSLLLSSSSIIFLIAYTNNNNNNILQQTHHHQIIIISGRYNDKVNSIAIPFLPRPSALDGSHAGDYGFDPLGLSEKLDFYAMQESEVRHARYVQFFFLPLSLWQNSPYPLPSQSI